MCGPGVSRGSSTASCPSSSATLECRDVDLVGVRPRRRWWRPFLLAHFWSPHGAQRALGARCGFQLVDASSVPRPLPRHFCLDLAEVRRPISSGSRNLHLQYIAAPRRQRDL